MDLAELYATPEAFEEQQRQMHALEARLLTAVESVLQTKEDRALLSVTLWGKLQDLRVYLRARQLQGPLRLAPPDPGLLAESPAEQPAP